MSRDRDAHKERQREIQMEIDSYCAVREVETRGERDGVHRERKIDSELRATNVRRGR